MALLFARPAWGGFVDCNANGLDDVEDVEFTGFSDDCNNNSIPDECDTRVLHTFEQGTDFSIPDNSPTGAAQDLVIPTDVPIAHLEIELGISHTRNHDLSCTLTHLETGTTLTLFSQIPGDSAGFAVSLADTYAFDLLFDGVPGTPAGQPIVGKFTPPQHLSIFDGESSLGTWRLRLIDHAAGETGQSTGWRLIVRAPIFAVDCDGNGAFDECELRGNDCDDNGVLDVCEPDSDEDSVTDVCDVCPGQDDLAGDLDDDGTPDPCDECDNDPYKAEAGACGCGTPDTDTDDDGAADCNDGCDADPDKTEPGQCGCGTPETDSDGDGVADCNDACPGGDDNQDCDGDGTADHCEPIPDCDNNGIPDNCDIDEGRSHDCNSNGVLDVCDLAAGTSQDCVRNGVPDECEGAYFADAGADRTMRLTDPAVVLGGSPSAAGGVGALSYEWSVVDGPDDPGALLNATMANASFQPTQGGAYVVELRVSDESEPPCVRIDQVMIMVMAVKANAGPDLSICVGVEGPALGAFPVAGGGVPPYSYGWFVIAGPDDGGLSSHTDEHPTFTPANEDEYTIRVTVTDSSDPPLTGSDIVVVTGVVLHANAGIDRKIPLNEVSELGSLPTAVGGAPPFAYEWELPTNPAANGMLSDASVANPVFQAVAAGMYVARVTITDASGCTASDEVTIMVEPEGDGPGPLPTPDLCGLCGQSGGFMSAFGVGAYVGVLALRPARRRRWSRG